MNQFEDLHEYPHCFSLSPIEPEGPHNLAMVACSLSFLMLVDILQELDSKVDVDN